jgi:hypothetical protein
MERKKMKLELTLEQIQVVVHGLGKLPLETAMGLFQEIDKQVRENIEAEKTALTEKAKLD